MDNAVQAETESILNMTTCTQEELPLSLMQRRRLAATGFHVPYQNLLSARFSCRGTLEIATLIRACRDVTLRHDALRNTFYQKGEEFLQLRHEEAGLEFHFVTGGGRDGQKQHQDSFYRPFDLQSGPFLRVRVTDSTVEHEFGLEFVIDHFVADGFSFQLLLDEIAHYYNGQMKGETRDLPYSHQQVDYARWQQATLTQARIQKVLDAWASRLAIDSSAIDSSGYSIAGPDSSMSRAPHETKFFQTSLGHQWKQRLLNFAASESVTPFAASAAIFARSLAMAESSSDVTFLSSFLGRMEQAHFGIVGDLARVLPMRLTPSYAPAGLASWAEEAMQALGFGIDHQDLPFGMINESLGARNGLYINLRMLPFFSVAEDLRLGLSQIDSSFTGISLRPDSVFPHSNWLVLRDTEASFETAYNPELVSAETIAKLHSGIEAAL
jgi:Condensation domain